MGLNPPVPQQDSNWEIRAAVLLSLFFQVLLIFMGPTRKRSSAPLYRLTVWSCYLLADWVADLALGLLLNNMGNIGGGGDGAGATANNSGSPIIFAFWTPFLLLHLGGPDTITAYSVEDNELWNRHLIGLLFELFSACVIIFCTLRGNPLVLATMLMLVAGVIKYGERTYSLYSSSAESLRDSMLGPPKPGPNYSRLMTEFDSKKKAGLPAEIIIPNGEASQAHKEMENQEIMKQRFLVLAKMKSVEARAYVFFLAFRRVFVDVIISFKERAMSQAFFLRDAEETRTSSDPDPKDEPTIIREAFDLIEVELNFIYDMVYTKAPIAYSSVGWVLRCFCSACLVSALVIFFFLDKPGHQIQRVDVGITYALLLGGLALDAAALLMIFFSNRAKVYLEESLSSRRLRWLAWWLRYQVTKRWQRCGGWSGTVSQMNLIRYCQEKPGRYSSNNRGGKWWLMIVKMLGIEEIVDVFFFIRRVRLNKDGEEERCGCLRRFFRETLVPKCCRSEEDSVAESLLFEFIFRDLRDAYHKLMKTMAEAAAAGTGTREEAMEEEIEAEKDAMAEKDAIAEVCRRRGDGVVKSHKDDIIKLVNKATTDGDGVVKSHEDDIKRVKGTTDGDARFKVILDSVVNRDFDESLLLWHIATDLCCCRINDTVVDTGKIMFVGPVGPLPQKTILMQAIAKTLSEYMLYLLIKQPDMLSGTAGIGLRPYRDTCEEARKFFDSMAAWNPDHADAQRMLLRVNTSTKPTLVKGDGSKSVLFDAVILAKALRELDEELMWNVITGVWREMLTSAAFSGRGSTHVRSLNRGGELITFVWLLMQHMGLSDMHEIWEGYTNAKLMIHY